MTTTLRVAAPREKRLPLSVGRVLAHMAGTDAKTVASKCLEAWSSGDFETARALFADDVTFVGPMGQTEGVDAYIEGVRGLKQIVSGTEQQLVFGEGENVCIIYDLVTTTPAGSIPCAGWYRVRDGQITSVRAFFDARPLTQ